MPRFRIADFSRGMSIAQNRHVGRSGYAGNINVKSTTEEEQIMPGNIFYIIGVIVVVLFILGYLGLR
jgi:hypothetical protein